MSVETSPGRGHAEPTTRDPVVRLDSVSKEFTMPRRGFRGPREVLRAVSSVSLTIEAGRTVGVVGESGSGKSTLGRMALGLMTPTSGTVSIDGTDLGSVRGEALRRLRREVQGVYQDPTGALNPRRTIRQSLAEPLRVAGFRGADLKDRITELLETVGLDPRRAEQRPRQFSGGQRQRIVIARALAASPRVVVADEPVSALDVSVQAQILNLFRDLQEEQDLGCLFVSHDLAVVGFVADSVVVMYRGEVVETGSAIEVLESPAHPYTAALRAAAHMEKADDPSPVAEVPGSEDAEIGCPYVDRCPLAMARCRIEKPALRDLGAGRTAACFALEVS